MSFRAAKVTQRNTVSEKKKKKSKQASKQASKQTNKQTADRPLFIYIENTFCQLTCQGPEFKSQQPHGQGKKKKKKPKKGKSG